MDNAIGGLTLNADMILVLSLVGFTMFMLVMEWIRADMVALLVAVVIGLTGLIPAEEVFMGFAGSAVIAIIAIMIMGEGLDRAGVLTVTASFVLKVAGKKEKRLGGVINSVASVLSAIIPSQALATLMIPISSRLSASTGVPLSRLLLPMAFCILTGTNTTLIANSPLILLNDMIDSANRNLPPGEHTIARFSLFSVTPVGVALALLGVAYFWFFARKLLPVRETKSKKISPANAASYFVDTYGINGDTFELTVTSESPLVGMSILEAEQIHDAPFILALKEGNETRMAPHAEQMIWIGTILGVMGDRKQVNEFAEKNKLRVSPRLRKLADLFNPSRAGIAEVVIPPSSRFIKQKVEDIHLRKRFGLSLLAINREDEVYREDLRDFTLQTGDTLVLHSHWRDLLEAEEHRDMVVVTNVPRKEQRPNKLWIAVGIFLGSMALSLFTDINLSIALMAGAIAMLLTGVLSMDEAYRGVNWKTIFVTACLLPLGWSMDATGAASWIAQEILLLASGAPQWVLQTMLAVITLLSSQVMSNVGATVMMVPVAISIALATGGNPSAYALIVAISSSNTFLISSGHPGLLLVSGPGGYRSTDFLRAGIPLTIMMLIVTVGVINLMYM